MAVNPNISLAVKGPEFADPMALYGKLAAIQGAQSQNQLAQYQLATAQRAEARDVARTNALAAAGTDEASIANALLKSGDIKGYSDFMKAGAERKTALLTQQKTQSELLDSSLKRARSFLDTIDPLDPDAPNQYIAWHEANHKDPIIGPVLAARGVTADQARARINQAIQQGPQAFANLLNQSKLGTEEFIKQNAPKITPQDLGGSTRLIQSPGLGGPATVVQGSVANKTPTITEDQRANEVVYIDVGNQLVPVNKLTGRPVENMQPTAKNLSPGQQQEVEYKDVGDKLVPVYKFNGQPVPGMQPIEKNLTPAQQKEIEYKDVGDKLIPVYKFNGQPVPGMQPIEKNLTPGDQQRALEVDYKDVGDKLVPVYKISGQPVEGAKAISKGLSPRDALQLDKIEWKSDGAQLIPFNYKGNRLNLPAIPLKASPDAAQSNKLAREKFEWEKANPGMTIKDAEDGSMLAINNKTGVATPVRMVNGALVAGKGKGLTESQGNATMFGMRMVEADNALRALEDAGVTDTGKVRTGVSGTAAALPLVGAALAKGVDNIFDVLPEFMAGLSPEQKRTLQARVNFITAVLRKESGASISPSEFETAEKIYFPKTGDSAAEIAQKQKTRKTVIEGMKVQAGPGASEINKRGGAGSAQVDTSNPLLR
ncbi:hypothetical protein UFOVP503_47 [uncultured Caudovirales phage]|uniref:Uncharacterized protein n=1 Tax=uncultured Caudovirales phage TaxID=2100421 RepID=A0A6J5MLX7_9CAUD|nr:hypothetical protein UFOVP503_47 [uncultured Caudovirales phage]CAB4161300.1 hypothetical protein UFOVP763_41 [uncultured Caudovirales phage]